MKSSPIRDLARRYAAGELSQENYRSQRRALIDAVTSGKQPLAYREDNNQGAGRPGNLKLLALAASAVLVMVVVFTVAWKASGNHHDAPRTESLPPATISAPTPGPALVRGFVETNDWDDPSLGDFVHEWRDLTADEQAKARASLLYPRLESELRQQITSERAMAGTGTGPQSDPHLAQLQKMAQTLGVTDTH